jgi:hypothetical protein
MQPMLLLLLLLQSPPAGLAASVRQASPTLHHCRAELAVAAPQAPLMP